MTSGVASASVPFFNVLIHSRGKSWPAQKDFGKGKSSLISPALWIACEFQKNQLATSALLLLARASLLWDTIFWLLFSPLLFWIFCYFDFRSHFSGYVTLLPSPVYSSSLPLDIVGTKAIQDPSGPDGLPCQHTSRPRFWEEAFSIEKDSFDWGDAIHPIWGYQRQWSAADWWSAIKTV